MTRPPGVDDLHEGVGHRQVIPFVALALDGVHRPLVLPVAAPDLALKKGFEELALPRVQALRFHEDGPRPDIVNPVALHVTRQNLDRRRVGGDEFRTKFAQHPHVLAHVVLAQVRPGQHDRVPVAAVVPAQHLSRRIAPLDQEAAQLRDPVAETVAGPTPLLEAIRVLVGLVGQPVVIQAERQSRRSGSGRRQQALRRKGTVHHLLDVRPHVLLRHKGQPADVLQRADVFRPDAEGVPRPAMVRHVPVGALQQRLQPAELVGLEPLDRPAFHVPDLGVEAYELRVLPHGAGADRPLEPAVALPKRKGKVFTNGQG